MQSDKRVLTGIHVCDLDERMVRINNKGELVVLRDRELYTRGARKACSVGSSFS